MKSSGDPGSGRRFAQGCLNDHGFDGSNLSFEPGRACGDIPGRKAAERTMPARWPVRGYSAAHWPGSSSRQVSFAGHTVDSHPA